MHPVSRRRIGIYHSPWHLLITFGFLTVPFVFLLFFARYAHLATDALLAAVMISTWRLIIAYCVAATLAWIMAVTFYHGARATISLPIFDVLQSFPTFALLPVATFLWGPSNVTVILVLIITVIWPIFFSIISSLKMLKHDWQEAATIADLTGWDYLRYFLWPVTVPGLISGSIVGIGNGWEALIATEIIVGLRTGLGEFFQAFAANPQITALGVLGFLILIFTINKLLWLPLLEWSQHETEE